jgi:hypothetical protein
MQKARLGGLLVAAALASGCNGNGVPPTAPAQPAPGPAPGTVVVPVDAHVVSRDEDRGDTPTFAWVASRPGIQGIMAGVAPAEVAWGTLRAIAPSYRLTDQALAVTRLDHVHDSGAGAVIAQFSQRVDGREVFGSRVGVALSRANQPVAVSGSLSQVVTPLGGKSFALDARGAIASAYEAMTASRLDSAVVSSHGLVAGYEKHTLAVVGGGRARTKAVWFPQAKGLEPAWYVELDLGHARGATSSLFAFVVSGSDGKILFEKDMVAADSFSYRVFADNGGPYGLAPSDSPYGTAPTPHPTGKNDDTPTTFPFVSTSLVTLQNVPFSKNDPWLAPGAAELKGNNVWAYADLATPDGFATGTPDLIVPPTAPGVWNRTFDPTKQANANAEQIRAGATHLFFNINYLHDFFYDVGYDEASGNAQTDNYGRGGEGNDPVLGEAQDFDGTDNANAATPADGESPRIQMFRWTTTNPGRDGDVDTTVISHEWGHTISNRLVGNSVGLSNSQGQGMGEGWGDFTALLTITRASDAAVPANANWAGVYALAGYVVSGTHPQYFGLRRYPYSTDMTKNPLTFKHIANGTALPAQPPPRQSSGGGNAEVHNTGEIWAEMLWECYASLLNVPGRTFVDANERMRRYYVGGLKLTPNAPTFTEARDGVLATMAAADAGDFGRCAAAFAKRGIGAGAISPPRTSTTNSPVTESFVTGNDLALVSAELVDGTRSCDNDGILDNNETAKLVVRVRNIGNGRLTSTTGRASSTLAGITFAAGGTITFPPSDPFQTVEGSVAVSLAGAAGSVPLTINVGVTDPTMARPRTLTASVVTLANTDYTLGTATTDRVDGPTAWTLDADAALDRSMPWGKQGTADGGQQWFWPDAGPTSDMRLVSPPLVVGAGPFSISFKNRWQLEANAGVNYDGGVIELSQDGGATWVDVRTSITANGYNGTISTDAPAGSAGNNPLLGRQAYVGTKTSAVTTTINFGTTYAGKTVQLRFRAATDQGGGNVGWEIDDIAVTGITNTPFATRIADRGQCLNRKPTANAGPDQTVIEGTLVQLAGSGSDPDNDPLTFTWSQLSGPAVALSGVNDPTATFTAPLVLGPAVVTLQLVASDGQLDSAPSTVNIHIGKLPAGPDMATPPIPDMATTPPGPDMTVPPPIPDMTTPPPPGPDMTVPPPGPDMTVPPPGPDMTVPPPGPDMTIPPPGPDMTTPPPPGPDMTTTPPGMDMTTVPPGADMTTLPGADMTTLPADGGSVDGSTHVDGGRDSGSGAPDMAHGGGSGGGCSCDVSQRGASGNGSLFMSVLMILAFAFRRRLPAVLFFLKR